MSGVYVGFERGVNEDMLVSFLGIDVARLARTYHSVALFFEVENGDLVFFPVTETSGPIEERVSTLPQARIRSLREKVDFIDLCVTSEEYDRLLRTCRGCVQAKLAYNYRDIFLSFVPLRCPEERTLFQVDAVFDAQFIILVLRECLSADHRLLPLLRGLHSRTTMTGQLFEVLTTASFRSRNASELITESG